MAEGFGVDSPKDRGYPRVSLKSADETVNEAPSRGLVAAADNDDEVLGAPEVSAVFDEPLVPIPSGSYQGVSVGLDLQPEAGEGDRGNRKSEGDRDGRAGSIDAEGAN